MAKIDEDNPISVGRMLATIGMILLLILFCGVVIAVSQGNV